MAGHARFTAVLDACVLFPIATADALLSLAKEGLYAAKWTRAIETEWLNAAVRHNPALIGRLDIRRDSMREAILDWEVDPTACVSLAPSLRLPDPHDVHVLAAAIVGHADCIVTANLKDFPPAALAPYGLTAMHPDAFIIAQLDLDLDKGLSAFRQMRARKKNPVLSAEDFASAMERNGLDETAARLREALRSI